MKYSKEDSIKYRIERAEEALDDAKMLLADGRLVSALNRGYYAAFYGAMAVLATKGLGTSKHSGVIALFNREFVKNGAISVRASKILHKSFDLRTKGDYKDFYVPKREDVQWLTEEVREFLKEIKDYLTEEHHIIFK